MPYIDGLPVATVINPTDVIMVDQGGTPGVPGTAVTRQATASMFNGGLGAYMPLLGGTFTGPVAHGSQQLSGSNVIITGGSVNGTPVGGATPAAGSFTTLSASGLVSGAGFIAWAASPPAIGGTAPAAGTFTTLSATSGTFATLSATGTITPAQVSGIVGTTTNNSAQAGSVGEYVPSLIPVGSAVSLTSATPANITSISLTAGDWDVWGTVATAPAGSTVTGQILASISTTSATLGGLPGFSQLIPYITAGAVNALPISTTRLSLASTTTVYLVMEAVFSTSTMSGYGFIGARRVR